MKVGPRVEPPGTISVTMVLIVLISQQCAFIFLISAFFSHAITSVCACTLLALFLQPMSVVPVSKDNLC
jgi:hypothetical protein